MKPSCSGATCQTAGKIHGRLGRISVDIHSTFLSLVAEVARSSPPGLEPYLGQPPMNAVISAPAIVPTMEATAPIAAPTM
jgi:hypothetical protein